MEVFMQYYNLKPKKGVLCAACVLTLSIQVTACASENGETKDLTPTLSATLTPQVSAEPSVEPTPADNSSEGGNDMASDTNALAANFDGITLKEGYKKATYNNPVMTQRFGADPYALVYDGRVYLYMTGDIFE